MPSLSVGSPRRGVALIAASALLILALGACSSDDAGGTGTARAPAVTLRDFAIAIEPTTLTAGDMTITAKNEGPSVHEFEVFRGRGDALPVASGVADTSGLDLVDELEDIAPGTSGQLALQLDPGTYTLICNLPSHYQQGMHVTFTVG
jgi:uncharacterized cupredoxin-like copper-binding protein